MCVEIAGEDAIKSIKKALNINPEENRNKIEEEKKENEEVDSSQNDLKQKEKTAFILDTLNSEIKYSYIKPLNFQQQKDQINNQIGLRFNNCSKINSNELLLNNELKENAKSPGSGKSQMKCNCSRSRCLKLYCECFAKHKTCEGCDCVGCLNREDNREAIDRAYQKIIERNPKVLQKFQKKKTFVCKCKFSNCQKNYCECFHNGKSCNSKCRCFECKNKIEFYTQRRNKKKLRKEGKEGIIVKPAFSRDLFNCSFDSMFTPQRKNYRNFKSESTAETAPAFTNVIQTRCVTFQSLGIPKNFMKLNLDQNKNDNIH